MICFEMQRYVIRSNYIGIQYSRPLLWLRTNLPIILGGWENPESKKLPNRRRCYMCSIPNQITEEKSSTRSIKKANWIGIAVIACGTQFIVHYPLIVYVVSSFLVGRSRANL